MKLTLYPFLLASLSLHFLLTVGILRPDRFELSFLQKAMIEKKRELSSNIILDLVERKENRFSEKTQFVESSRVQSKVAQSEHQTDIYYHPPPQYPREALQQKIEGEMRVEVRTNHDGVVISTYLEQSTGHPLLDSEALQTVKKWRLTPNSVFHIPFHFKIVGKNEQNSIDHSSKE